MRVGIFVFSNLCYIFLVPLYTVTIILISLFASFIVMLLTNGFLRTLRVSFTIKLPNSTLLVLLFIIFLAFPISLMLTNVRSSIYGPYPISYITKAIVSITRPAPNFLYSFVVLVSLISISIFMFLGLVFASKSFSDIMLTLPEFNQKEGAKNIFQHKMMEGFSILNNLPFLIKHDLLIFLRRGESFRLIMSQLLNQTIIFVIFIVLPLSIEKFSSDFTTYGVTYRYSSFSFIVLILATLSLVYGFLLQSEGKGIFLVKLSPAKMENFVLMKFLSSIIISLTAIIPFLALIFAFFTSSKSPYYILVSLLQYFVLYLWMSTYNFYNGMRTFNSEIILGNVEGRHLDIFQLVFTLLIFAVWFWLFKVIYLSIPFLSISVIAAELLAPIILIKKIIIYAAFKLENLSVDLE